jgi:hypothetical protein
LQRHFAGATLRRDLSPQGRTMLAPIARLLLGFVLVFTPEFPVLRQDPGKLVFSKRAPGEAHALTLTAVDEGESTRVNGVFQVYCD